MQSVGKNLHVKTICHVLCVQRIRIGPLDRISQRDQIDQPDQIDHQDQIDQQDLIAEKGPHEPIDQSWTKTLPEVIGIAGPNERTGRNDLTGQSCRGCCETGRIR